MKRQKGTLTIKKLEEIVSVMSAYKPADNTIKWWKEPLLWMLYPLFGHKETSDNWVFYFVKFRSTLYLLKSEQL